MSNSILRVGIILSCGFACLLIRGAPATAASILNLELIPDGSAAPPGDRLEFLPLMAPGEKEATCEIRAYTVGANGKHPAEIKANGSADRDTDGAFLISRHVAAQADRPIPLTIVVPYSELDLDVGTHWMGYCVILKCKDQPPVVVATRLTKVIISDRPRDHMQLQKRSVKQTVDTRQETALVGKAPGSKGSEAVRKSFTLSTPKDRIETESTEVTVNIPGGFERFIPPLVVARGDDSNYADRDQVSASPTALTALSTAQPTNPRLVYFATNRAPAQSSTPDNPQFSSDLGTELITGKCVVNIPVQHQLGILEQPILWLPLDPNIDFMVQSTKLVAGDSLFKEATAQDLLLYIHGFNTEFDFAVLRAAQLHYDLQFPGSVMAMCWPSAGSMLAYAQDRKNAEQSAGRLADLLQSLVTNARQSAGNTAPRKIHLLAHSLGNDVLMNAVYELHSRGVFAEKDVLFGQVILAAPDVGALEFNNLLPFLQQHSQRVTYYYCTQDAALTASRQLNEYEPVGLMAFFQSGLDTINADQVDTSFMYHGYYASSRQVLSDMELMIEGGRPPDQRLPPLAPATTVLGHQLWSFAAPLLTAATAPAPTAGN